MKEIIRNVGIVNYAQKTIPDDYKCDGCGVHGVKLWREYQTIASQTKLFCAHCAEEDQKKNHEADWRSPFSIGDGDQIGWFIPAVPVEGQNTYWGYSSVPGNGVDWWKSLPIKK
ncbi:MAG TPA: hypothetical protein PK142_02465 [bacterium]|nr:hypothetical protein [bacterium]